MAGAAESLRECWPKHADIVVLTNAPDHAREPRARWLVRHGMDYPLIINEGPKGEAVASLTGRTARPAAFVDDLLHNLDSAAERAGRATLPDRGGRAVAPICALLAPSSAHRRLAALAEALAEALQVHR